MELRISHISKRYKNGIQALQDVSLTIRPGMFGLLGPNGAGKSTLMRTIAALQEPDCGEIELNGLDLLRQKGELRKILGYLPQEFGLYPQANAEDMLDHFAALKGVARYKERKTLVEALLRQTNLYDVRKKKLGSFSGGMKQRFGIAMVLIGAPKLIVVDEPTAGLDPEERSRFHNLLSEIGERAIVILSTHIVDDVSDLCRDMAIVQKGRVIYTGQPLDAINLLGGQVWQSVIPRTQLSDARQKRHVISSRLFMGDTIVHVLSREQPGPSFLPVTPSLEDVYFSVLAEPKGATADSGLCARKEADV